MISRERPTEEERLRALRDECVKNIRAKLPDITINTNLKYSLPHMLNISIPDINAEYLVLLLDRAGLALSTKSACREGDAASHVVAALGGEEWRARNTLRISLGRSTGKKDLGRLLAVLLESIPKAGQMGGRNPS